MNPVSIFVYQVSYFGSVGAPGSDIPSYSGILLGQAAGRRRAPSKNTPEPIAPESSEDESPPYVWSGTNVYPRPGAREWAMYFLLRGAD